MAITHLVTGYAGVEHIQSADEGAFNAAFFGGGQYVMESGNMFEGSIVDNNTVRILDGDLLMYGRHIRIKPDTYEDMTITTGTAGTNRIDLICVTYEKNANDGTETAYFEVIKGTEASGTAVAPNYTNGNILEGATKNQMPMYKVTVEGVVLSSIERLFTTIPTYKTLAEKYAAEFQQACESHLESLNVLDTVEEVLANTQTGQLAGALAFKEMKTIHDDDIADLQNQVEECFQSVSDGKALIASAITGKRVSTDATASFAQMATNINAITLGSGNAQKANVLAGKTFTNDDGVEYTGTMVNNAGKTVTASAVSRDDTYTYFTIPATAHYSTTSKVKTENSNLSGTIGSCKYANAASSFDIPATVNEMVITLAVNSLLYMCGGVFKRSDGNLGQQSKTGWWQNTDGTHTHCATIKFTVDWTNNKVSIDSYVNNGNGTTLTAYRT